MAVFQDFLLLFKYSTRHLDTCTEAFPCLLLSSLPKTLQDLCQVFTLSSASESRLCLEFRCLCHKCFSPSLSFFERLQPTFLWLRWGFLLYSSFALSLNKEWLAFNLCAELWECVIRPVCSILGYDAQVEIKQNVWSQIQELSCFYTGI